MRITSIRTRLLTSYFIIIGVFTISVAIFGIYEINSNIVGRAQKQLSNDIKAARMFYGAEIDKIKDVFSIIPGPKTDVQMNEIKKRVGLDYFYTVKRENIANIRSEIVKESFLTGHSVGGTRIIDKEELEKMGTVLFNRAKVEIKFTPHAAPTDKKVLESAMAIGYAAPVAFDAKGNVSEVMYGGKLINRDFELVDKIRDYVFENKLYNGKPVGSVTIFQDDVRIATNVLNKDGTRAIGTRVSEKVFDKVINKGQLFFDKAFVVTDWYLTAYEPIKDIKGNVIGILYVGILEEPFRDMKRNILIVFLLIVLGAAGIAAMLSFILEESITSPISRLLEATEKLSGGELHTRVMTKAPLRELNKVARAFNIMAQSLSDRDKKLKELNTSYLDLIGFVAHELKGILSSTILNAYSVRDGFLGMINFKQRKSMDAVVKNLDYFDATIKNFLNLSRIEKGEMHVNKIDLNFKEEIIESSISEFKKLAEEKGINIQNSIEGGLKVKADYNLMLIVANNLIGNAVKYGAENGRIVITAKENNDKIEIEVFNTGRPLSFDEVNRLFRKFSRLESAETKKAKGTGLGLFITKEIIEKHGGDIRVEPGKEGNSFIFTLERKA